MKVMEGKVMLSHSEVMDFKWEAGMRVPREMPVEKYRRTLEVAKSRLPRGYDMGVFTQDGWRKVVV